jgi:hypothetical protein
MWQLATMPMADIDKANDKDYDEAEAGQALRSLFGCNPMRSSIFIAAALSAAALFPPTASRANPMFTVTAASPGAINFSGSGTAQFNNSIGTNNSFQVGSSTNLGVNASTSSTPEYQVKSTAKLDLAGTSVLQQVIGTSGTFKDNTSQATNAYSAASNYAVDVMSSAGWGSSYETASASKRSEYTSESAYNAAYQAEYKAQVSAGYEATSSSTRSDTQSQGTDGVISGNFRTVDVGSARAGGSSVDWSSSASAAADVKHGSSYENRTVTTQNETEWKAAYDSEYNQAYAQASAASNRYTDSSVTVRGIGSDANVAAAASSTFEVDISASSNAGSGSASTSTANGSAGANLATSSFANQSQASTASAFMQAFGSAGTTTTP